MVGKMYKADRALYIEGRCSNGGALDVASSDHAGDERRAPRRHLERRENRNETMPMKKRGTQARRGAQRGRVGRRQTGRGSGAGARESARRPRRAGTGVEPRSFGSRKPKGSFGARGFEAAWFRAARAVQCRSRGCEPRSSFGDRKPKNKSARRDEKPRSAGGTALARRRAGRGQRTGRRATSMRAGPRALRPSRRRPQAARPRIRSAATARRASRRSPNAPARDRDRRADRHGRRGRSRHAGRPLFRGEVSRPVVQPHPAHRAQRRSAGERQARRHQGPAADRPAGAHSAAQAECAEAGVDCRRKTRRRARSCNRSRCTKMPT